MEPYKNGDIWKARIINIETSEVVEDVYAYDVDYLQLRKGQTCTDNERHRYSTNTEDKTAVTPMSSFTDVKDHPYYNIKGDLKIRACAPAKIGLNGGTITFSDNNKEGETGSFKCDVDNGGIIFDWNIFSPVIYPENGTESHNKE